MLRTLSFLLLLFILDIQANEFTECPCHIQSHCDPITAGVRREVFVFQLEKDKWKKYDWSKVTTVAMFEKKNNSDLMCHAHSNGARVVFTDLLETTSLTNSTATNLWLEDNLKFAKEHFLDGINIDIEGIILNGSPERKLLTELVQNTTKAFHEALPHSQVTFDVGWSSNCTDLRCYDYKGLANACDFLFVMAYDEQSQIWGPCIAMPNAPLMKTQEGIKSYLNLTIEARKLVLGVPWYGYDYPCCQLTQDNTCSIDKVPFRGANCSDAAGKQKDYSTVTQLLANSTSGPQWNCTYLAPYFNYKNATGCMHQVWYDDPQSLEFKYAYAAYMNLRGIGIWHGDCLDYSDDPTAKQLTKAMWDAVWKSDCLDYNDPL